MNTKQFQNAIAYSAISFGKLIAAIGQTPIEKLDPDLQNDLVLYSALIQTAASAVLIDFTDTEPTAQLGFALTFIGYGSFALQFLRDVDDPNYLIVRARSANLKEMLGNFILTMAPNQAPYWKIGTIIVTLGNLLEALGRSELLQQDNSSTLFNVSVTRGVWIQAIGWILLTLSYLHEIYLEPTDSPSSAANCSRSQWSSVDFSQGLVPRF